jgi:alkylation response protein AidB-like acyl-CoA dehydrogenase
MKLSFDDSIEAFRAEFREWLTDNAPTHEEMGADPAVSSAHVPEWARRWARRLFDAGWLVPAWPPERGGRNAGPVETLVYLEEFIRAGIPRTTNPQGLGIVAPSIFDYGNDQQIRDYAMPLLRGERSACLGMSEPGAGSDLASLSTRAELDGDRFVINGQKVWTSGANYADFCFLFCRTDRDAPKHKGISVLLVDMDAPGLTVRPLPEIVEPQQPDLNEVFFEDVVVPRANLVGTMNNGWAMAGGSLTHERGMVWLQSVLALEEGVRRVLDAAPALLDRMPAAERAVATDRVVSSYVDAIAARALGYRAFAKLVRGGTAPEQALMKLFCTEAERQLNLVASEMSRDHALDAQGGLSRYEGGSWTERYFLVFGNTISAGSSEIQRNIIATRVLGLPRQ